MANKRLRVFNQTSDVSALRVYVMHFQAGVSAKFDVAQGQFVQNNQMTPGDRGYIVYEDFNEEVILTGSVKITTTNVKLAIFGDSINGYSAGVAAEGPQDP